MLQGIRGFRVSDGYGIVILKSGLSGEPESKIYDSWGTKWLAFEILYLDTWETELTALRTYFTPKQMSCATHCESRWSHCISINTVVKTCKSTLGVQWVLFHWYNGTTKQDVLRYPVILVKSIFLQTIKGVESSSGETNFHPHQMDVLAD